jgi:16S rRNA (adenine1518-N6/adenine1519-N6)-dimethyltransferase
MNHLPRKRFSQNFLQDPNIITRIIDAIAPQKGEHFVEIGPGLGALTKPLLTRIGQLDAIELDRDLIVPLQQTCANAGTLNLTNQDALTVDFSAMAQQPHSLRIVGNLPYQISTPLLFHLIEHITAIRDLHFMLQKEVVDRMAAEPGNKVYGRLSVMIQYHFAVQRLFLVPPGAFYPQPKVTSAIVRLRPQPAPVLAKNYALFSEIVKQAFNYRRKTLHNSLHNQVDNVTLTALGIDPASRAEQLSVSDFVRIANGLP